MGSQALSHNLYETENNSIQYTDILNPALLMEESILTVVIYQVTV